MEQGQFALGRGAQELKRELNRTALLALVEGMDIKIIRQRKRYRQAGCLRNGPRELDSAVSEIFLGFQAAKSR